MTTLLKDHLEYYELIGARVALNRLRRILTPAAIERLELETLSEMIEESISRCERISRYRSSRDEAKNGAEMGGKANAE